MIPRIEQKYLDAIKISLPLGPFFYYTEKYFFADWEFLRVLLVLMAIDWIWGVVLAFRAKTFSQEGFAKLGKKLAEYGTLLIIGHVFLNVRSGGQPLPVFSYFTTAIHSYLMVREAISILEKIAKSNPDLVPDWILNRLKVYRNSGKIDQDENEKD